MSINLKMVFIYSKRTVSSHDVWQFGIVIFVCLTGCLPWQKAAPDDPRYVRYEFKYHILFVLVVVMLSKAG